MKLYNFLHVFLLTFFLTFSTLTYADPVTLTPDQQARIAAVISEVSASTPAPAPAKPAVDVAKEWANLGTSIGVGLVSAAKQLGVAASEFAQTDLGKITTVVIVWKFLGNDFLHVTDWILKKVSGALLVFVGIPFCLYKARSIGQEYRWETRSGTVLFGAHTYNKPVKISAGRKSHLTDSEQALTAAYLIATITLGVAGLINLF